MIPGLALKAWIVCGCVVAVPAVLVAVYLFCRAEGTWRERLRMFGGGT